MQLSYSQHLTESLAKSVEDLMKSDLPYRLSALYSLERISNESSKHNYEILKIITVMVRTWNKQSASQQQQQLEVFEALKIIGRRKPLIREGVDYYPPLDLSEIKISKFDLSGGNYQKCNFTASEITNCNLENCDFRNAIFDQSNLSESNLSNSIFRNASLENTNLTATGIHATDFSGVDITSTTGLSRVQVKGMLKRSLHEGVAILTSRMEVDLSDLEPE
jgi:uncharacterized protein YjbI with pentapeptide repeats